MSGLESSVVDELAKDVTSDSELRFDEFCTLIDLLDQVAEQTESVSDRTVGVINAPADLDDGEISETELLELNQAAFEELASPDSGLVSTEDFRAWDDIQELLQDGVLSHEDLDAIIIKAGASSGYLNFEQFNQAIQLIDTAADSLLEADSLSDDGDDADLIESIESNSEENFALLAAGSDRVSIENFKNWSDVREIIDLGLVGETDIDKALLNAEVNAVEGMTIDQFKSVISHLNSLPSEIEDINDDEDEELSESTIREMAKSSFLKLKGPAGRVSIEAFKTWDEVQNMVSEDLVTQKDISSIMSAVGADERGMDIEQFTEAVLMLDEVANENSEDEEGILHETFEILKSPNGRVSRSAFIEWDDVQELMNDGFISKNEINAILDELGVGMEGMDFDTYALAIQRLDETAAAESGENEDDEEDSEVSWVGKTRSVGALRDLFMELRDSKTEKVPVSLFLKWSELDTLFKNGVIDEDTLNILLGEVNSKINGDLSFEQFQVLISMIDQLARVSENEISSLNEGLDGVSAPAAENSDPASSEENDLEELSEEEMEAMTHDAFEELKSKNGKVSVKRFKTWESIKEALEEGDIREKDVEDALKKAGVGKSGEMDYETFKQAVRHVEDFLMEQEVDEDETDTEEPELDEGSRAERSELDSSEGDDFEELSEEEMEALTRDAFEELKSKNGKVSVKRFKTWESIKEALEEGDISEKDLEDALKKAGVGKSGEMDYETFKQVVRTIEDPSSVKLDVAAGSSLISSNSAGKGFGTAIPQQSLNPKISSSNDEVASISDALFDELRGRKATISLEDFRKWKELEDMIQTGSLKLSVLERALKSAGCLDTEEITRSQFVKILDSISASADLSNALDSESEEDGSHQDEEELAIEIYNQLRGNKVHLELIDFLKWEDVQELLECGALSKDDLASAVDSVGVSVEHGGISFEQFSRLLALIDDFIDNDKIPNSSSDNDVIKEHRIVVDKETKVEDVMDMVDEFVDSPGETKVSYISTKGSRSEGIKALDALSDDLEDDEDLDEEAMEMVSVSKSKYVFEITF